MSMQPSIAEVVVGGEGQQSLVRLNDGAWVFTHDEDEQGRVCTTWWGEEVCACGRYRLEWWRLGWRRRLWTWLAYLRARL